ncbi:MAG: DNA replication and repair protein RecF, partial [Halioglobus sp.]|nr:DNA replication and repair protein RecF [Halioglobus sp.]
MPLLRFSCTDFRCLDRVSFEPHPRFSLIAGPNASGKTSLLEGIAYLGRGRSFRNASASDLVQHGAEGFLVQGEVHTGSGRQRVGVRNGRAGLEFSIDGDGQGGLSALVDILPLQLIDPEVHQLVAGAPEERRRFLEWMTFHVEQGYLDVWRRFRRALKQRNASLRSGGKALDSWDRKFVETALAVDAARKRVLLGGIPVLGSTAGTLLGADVTFEYKQGWSVDADLVEQLQSARQRDLVSGTTSIGPHRADLRLRVDERVAKRLVSRGQQKLLACSMVLGSVAVVAD